MTRLPAPTVRVVALGEEERALVWLAAVIAAGCEPDIRTELGRAQQDARAEWIEEVILQSYLLPVSADAQRGAVACACRGRSARDDDGERLDRADEWRRGEATCASCTAVLCRLRRIRALHPALDAWMIVEGYGKVLSRPALDLARRELCIVAACAASRQDRQLHSHLHGALHAGAS
jgi:4-carboxymuconolactone decarboxylase